MYFMCRPIKILDINQIIKCIALTTWFRASLCRARNPELREGVLQDHVTPKKIKGYEGKHKDLKTKKKQITASYGLSESTCPG